MNAEFVRVVLWAAVASALTVANVGVRHAVAQVVPNGRFVDLMSLGSGVNDSSAGVDPHVSTDGSALYFSSIRSGIWEIYQATRNDDEPFGNVMNVGLGGPDTGGPFISQDGSKLYFYSNQTGDFDLFVATKSTPGGPFDVVTDLGDVNTNSDENGPHVSGDGRRLYFASNRPDGEGDLDLYMATRNDDNEPFTNVMTLGSDINSPYDEYDPSLSSDELTIFFSGLPTGFGTDRPEGEGEGDIWVATRGAIGEQFGEAVNLDDFSLGSDVNTPFIDGAPFISRDWPAIGSKLYFSTSRDSESAVLWQATWVPEPSTVTLALLSLVFFCRKRKFVNMRSNIMAL